MSEVKWSGADVLEFLNIYRGYPELWCLTSTRYPNREAKKESFQELMRKLKEIGLHTKEEPLKKKIKSIRDTYRSELKKVNISKMSGSKRNKVYKPKLIWYETADAFLNTVLSARQTSSNLDKACICQHLLSVETQLKEDVEDERGLSMEGVLSSKMSTTPSSSQPPSYGSPTRTKQERNRSPLGIASQPPFKTVKTDTRPNYPSRHDAGVDSAAFLGEDQYVTFAKHVASQLRQLPVRSFIQLQNQIQQLITNERLKELHSDQVKSTDNIVCAQILSPDSEFYPGTNSELRLIEADGKMTVLKISPILEDEV